MSHYGPVTVLFFILSLSMATIRFKIASDRLEYRKSTVYLCVTIKGRFFRISTGQRVSPDKWDNSGPEGKTIGRDRESLNLRAVLDNIKGKVNQLMASNDIAGRITTKAQIETLITHKLQPAEEEAKTDLWQFWEDWITRQDERQQWSKSTVQQHNNTRHLLKEYQTKRKQPVTFLSLNKDLVEDYTGYLRKIGKKDSTIAKEIKNMKVFARHAEDAGEFPEADYAKWQKPASISKEVFYLSDEDLDALRHTHYSTDTLQQVADLFLMQCYTGLRFSDIAGLKPEQWDNDWLRVNTQKTKQALKIALSPEARHLLERYKLKPMSNLSNPTVNKLIKEAGKEAGLTQQEQVTEHQGQTRKTVTLHRYERITTHTGRRTFVSRALSKGIPLPTIMRFTGHKSLKTLAAYIGISDAELLSSAKKLGGGETE